MEGRKQHTEKEQDDSKGEKKEGEREEKGEIVQPVIVGDMDFAKFRSGECGF